MDFTSNSGLNVHSAGEVRNGHGKVFDDDDAEDFSLVISATGLDEAFGMAVIAPG